jgi:hypothetical protein
MDHVTSESLSARLVFWNLGITTLLMTTPVIESFVLSAAVIVIDAVDDGATVLGRTDRICPEQTEAAKMSKTAPIHRRESSAVISGAFHSLTQNKTNKQQQ